MSFVSPLIRLRTTPERLQGKGTALLEASVSIRYLK